MNMAKEPRKGKDHPDAKAMVANRDERAKANEEAMKRMASSQPTPTQEENDLARIGIVVDEKEDDKSGPTVITKTMVANEPLTTHGYETKTTKAKESNEQNGRTAVNRRASDKILGLPIPFTGERRKGLSSPPYGSGHSWQYP